MNRQTPRINTGLIEKIAVWTAHGETHDRKEVDEEHAISRIRKNCWEKVWGKGLDSRINSAFTPLGNH